MDKTFNIENMETYFKNYVPCLEHQKQPITNFCTEQICLKFLCPECVEIHSRTHANHSIESIKTCVKKTSGKLQHTVKQLETQIKKNEFLSPQNHEQFTKKLIRQMEEVKISLINQINMYFKQKQAEVRRQTSKYQQTQKNLQNLKKNLAQAVSQLKLLQKNLFVNKQTVFAIKKANSIDYQNMISHFKDKIYRLQKDVKINVKLEMDPIKRQQFRNSLSSLIGVRSKDQQQERGNDVMNLSPSRYEERQYIVNPIPLNADRLINKNSLLIEHENFFQSRPFLHFFQLSKSALHVIQLKDIKQGQSLKWQTFPLNISFAIPQFHRTIATEDGNIFMIGGTNMQTKQKVSSIYKFLPMTNILKEVSKLNIPRSSHSIICHKKLIYIIGGMSSNDQILKKCQVFDPNSNLTKLISPCKYPTNNSCVMAMGNDTILKLGGSFGNGQNSDHIQMYNIVANIWAEVDPVIENIKGDFGLLSCSGWAPLNMNQVFVFGGYNQEADNQNSSMSFVIEYSKQENEYSIKHTNIKNLPIAEGFWNSQSIIYQNTIYALQNVDDETGDCVQDKRNILIFNGKSWTVCYT